MLIFLAASLSSLNVNAQEKTESSFYLGLGGGYLWNNMSVTHLDKNMFPDNKWQGSGLFDLFLQYELGSKKQFGIRLEVDFLKRGGLLNNIYNTSAYPGFYDEEGISDISYRLKANYTDIRLPLIYQFCDARSMIRPYVYVAPMVCFATGGDINARVDYNDGAFSGSRLKITDGNIRPAYFAGALGVGFKYDLDLHGHPFYFSVEANYQMGFTDTYSSKEKSGSAAVKDDIFHYAYDISGTRKFNGFEIKGSISIPFSIFSKKKVEYVAPEPVYNQEPQEVVVIEEPVVEVEDLPCRSIDEVSAMISRGEDIRGVTFCSIDDIRFETGKSNLYPSSYAYLDKLAKIIKETGVSIEVAGHTDNVGTHDFNMRLSKDRALAVVNYLKKAGVPKNQLSYSFYGETMPIRDNATEAGRSINRRVEFEIK